MSSKALKACPRIIIAGTSGDSGKTLVSLGLLAGIRQLGYHVTAFKKGPDYIDPAWLNAASGGPVRNLDTYLVPGEKVHDLFVRHASDSAPNIIEGNRGLYDGFDVYGSHSTAELAKLLDAPVILVCNATKSTRTVAAVVLGMQKMDEEVKLTGVIINQVGGKRHKKIVTEAIENTTGIPVLGAIPRVKEEKLLPSRHLGLVTPAEYPGVSNLIAHLGEIISENVDLERIMEIANSAPEMEFPETENDRSDLGQSLGIGYFSDSAFTFYYPENLECLSDSGAELIPVSSLDDRRLPDIDALYIGGGFPETHAEKLAKNRELMDSVKSKALEGLPVYAECGGLIYLCNSLMMDGKTYPMAGLFDVDLVLKKKPQGHGYSLMEVDADNPFFPIGEKLKGHEFHYTTPIRVGQNVRTAMAVTRGSGFAENRDGLVLKSVWASYLHLHASGEQSWGKELVKLAREFSLKKHDSHEGGSMPGFQRHEV
jgi:cobyrinic acid a,c-diamide synthase